MTNRILNADALLDWFYDIATYKQNNNEIALFVDIKYGDIFDKINELATPAEPQESVYDDVFELINKVRKQTEPLKQGDFKYGWNAGLLALENELILFVNRNPQESIFDAEGWNNNFAETPQGYDTPILIKYYCDWKKCKRVTVGHYSENPDCPEEDGFYTWYETGCIGESNKVKNLISWRLLPTGGNHD
jgi:hypothetical protein